VRAAALESAAAFVAFIESGMTFYPIAEAGVCVGNADGNELLTICVSSTVEDLRTPLLHALELALADGPCHGDCDSRCGAEAALRGVQVLCKSQVRPLHVASPEKG
jgi:hypothetical protein